LNVRLPKAGDNEGDPELLAGHAPASRGAPPLPSAALLRFGPFRLDLEAGELHKGEARVRLRHQPLLVLARLASRSGRLVSRDELRHLLWGEETFVAFDQSLNYCVMEVRAALGDDAEAPLYVETLPRRGYRFIAPVEQASAEVRGVEPSLVSMSPTARSWAASLLRWRWTRLALATLLVTLTAALSATSLLRAPADERLILAVLPFDVVGGDAEARLLADGLHEELITQLGRLEPSRLGVIARTASLRDRGATGAVNAAGPPPGADYMMMGSVRRAAGRVRISVALRRTRDGVQTWTASYERALDGALDIESDVARAVAREFRFAVQVEDEAMLDPGRGSGVSPL
jgi:TolB-like protein/DNA-binding winged helix-turn-helix (wHTH) protein